MAAGPALIAFDTSGRHCAAAVLTGGAIVAERCVDMGRGQAEALMPLLADLLHAAGLSWRDLDGIGVGTGPGNFTGIRIAVAAARGLGLGLGVRAIGVSGFEAAAHGRPGPVLVSLPAPRDRVYLQLLQDGACVNQPWLSDPGAPASDLALPRDTAVVGHAALRIGAALGLRAGPAPGAGCAARIARVAATRLDMDLPRPAPLYVRPADAVPPADPPPVILP